MAFAHTFPSPETVHPAQLPNGEPYPRTVFLKAAIKHPRWDVGDYSFASSFSPSKNWAAQLAPYLHRQSPEKLVIGKFCQLAAGVMFVTASANHRYDGFTTYPFGFFGTFDSDCPSLRRGPYPDTVLGHDVWIGQGARILPGAQIGTGSIIGSGAVVGGVIPPYSVVVGNPGVITRQRFDDTTIERLLDIAWWDWPINKIMTHQDVICAGDLDHLEAVAAMATRTADLP